MKRIGEMQWMAKEEERRAEGGGRRAQGIERRAKGRGRRELDAGRKEEGRLSFCFVYLY